MIKMLDKLLHKHYIQCGLAILLTVAILWFTASLWLNKVITVSFVSQTAKDIEYQVFYTEAKGQHFNQLQSVKQDVKSGTRNVEILLPIEKIINFRLDIGKNGSKPGKVIISDLKISGLKNVEIDASKFKQNQIDKFAWHKGIITLVSKQGDPYLQYRKELNLSGKIQIDWYQLIILSVLIFLLMYKFVQYLSQFKIEKLHSRIDIVMLAVFFALLYLPMIHISDATKSEQENRMLAPKPALMLNSEQNYGPQFDSWYNDHFFGRNYLVYLHDFIRFGINKYATGHNAMLGKDGWLWGTNFNAVKMFQNANLFTEDELQQVGKHIDNFVKNAKKSGVKEVYFILSNDKESMYPEYYPSYIKKIGKVSRLEQVVQYLHKNYPQIKLYNFKKELDELKAKEIIFYKAGTHLNQIGAFKEYSLLMNEIKKDFPEINVLSLNDFKVKVSNEKKGDFALFNYFSLLPFYSQDNFKNKYLFSKSKSVAKVKDQQKVGFFIINSWNNEKVENKYNLLVISDSFMAQYMSYLAMSFKDIRHLFFGGGRDFDLQQHAKDLPDKSPDIIIVGSVERFLQRFLTLEFPNNLKSKD